MTLRFWTMAEIKFLRENFMTMPYKAISRKLDRSVVSIRKRVCLLGLRKTFPWTTKQVEMLLTLKSKGCSWREIGAAIGCGESPAKNMLTRLKKWQKAGLQKKK